MLYVDPILQQDQMKYIINFLNIYEKSSLLLLLNIFNKMLISRDFSSDWKKAIIISLPKPGKNPTMNE